jgi:hypothetical protein
MTGSQSAPIGTPSALFIVTSKRYSGWEFARESASALKHPTQPLEDLAFGVGGLASGFFPTRPHGASVIGVSRQQTLRAVAFGSRLPPTRPAKDFRLQSRGHARHTSLRHTQRAALKEREPAERHLSFAGSCSDNRID